MPTLIEFDHVTLGYGQRVILKDISLTVDEGDYFGLVGPNGAGKTTILRAILGVLRPMNGAVRIHSSTTNAVRVGYVPQRDSIDQILPYTVQEVVLMGRYHQIGLLRRPRGNDHGIVDECLQHVDIQALRNVAFKDLSGGQKQRTLIARALASQPNVLILDEPTNGMDLSSKTSILQLVNHLHEHDKLTVIMVSHLLDDVANHVKRIALVDRNFFQVGEADQVLTAQNLSTMYQLPVSVTDLHGAKVIQAGATNGHE